jgi:DNA-directed RNA polymerase specialized sigma24 family protein
MPPTDKTPTSIPETPEVYHKINKCQDPLVRAYLLYVIDPTEERRDELLRGCLTKLKRSVRYYVRCCGICPSWMGPDTFADDAFSLAVEKFWRGIRSLRNPKKLRRWLKDPEKLPVWLRLVAYSTVNQEYRSRVRRLKKGPVHFECMEREVAGDAD